MTDYEGAYFGMYFAEVADYFARENNDERQLLKLLYQSLKAISAPSLPNSLVKCIFEIKAIVVNGEYPGAPTDMKLESSTLYTLSYIEAAPIEKLYTFTVKESVLAQLQLVADRYRRRFMNHDFKSLEILKTLC